MKPIVFFISFFIAGRVTAQVPPPPPAINLIDSFTTVQVEARFPGKEGAWMSFLQKNVKGNTPSKNNAPKGNYSVLASFYIDSTGTLTAIKIEEDPGYGCAEDVRRVLQKSPKWIPATINGKPVNYYEKQKFGYVVE